MGGASLMCAKRACPSLVDLAIRPASATPACAVTPSSCCRVAEQAGRAAKAAGSKLKEGASELAANLTSWWANLEPADRFALPGVSTQSKHQVGGLGGALVG